MKIFTSKLNPINEFEIESQEERQIIESNLVRSKLALDVSNKKIPEAQLSIEKGQYFYKDGNQLVLQEDIYKNLNKLSFYIRSILDGNSIRQGCIPLHAAAFNIDSITGFLFSSSNGGKSTILRHICSEGAEFIGDDHIIIGEKKIRGNSVARIRNPPEDKYEQYSSQGCPYKNYYLFAIDCLKNSSGKIEEISKEDFSKRVKSSSLKYVLEEPLDNQARKFIQELNLDIQHKYIMMFDKFIEDSKGCFICSGLLMGINYKIKEQILQ